MLIREATPADAPGLRAIYAPFVTQTAVSFETEVPSVATFAERIERGVVDYAYLVAEVEGDVAGYAYGGAHRPRAAYRFSVEVSAYVDPRRQRGGIGRSLYAELLPRLAARGYAGAFAGIALPNDASIGLHRLAGFEEVGTFRRVGFKFDKWWDVYWMQRALGDGAPQPGQLPK